VVWGVNPDFLDPGVIKKLLERAKPEQLVSQILTKWLSRTVLAMERHLIGNHGGQILPRIDQPVAHPLCQRRTGIEWWGHSPIVSMLKG
jgi:hypothetical protein